MGILEVESARRKRISDIQKIILSAIAVAGVLSVGAVAPTVLGAMSKAGIIPNKRQNEITASSRKRLIERKLLEYKNGFLTLTVAGEKELRLSEAKGFTLKKPKRWDKKWRLLVFDIPERRKGLRQRVRKTLIAIGFVRLQDSVWIYPYDCEDFITLLKADFKVGKDMLYMVVDVLENDKALKQRFSLLH